jgi:hypothetical protein
MQLRPADYYGLPNTIDLLKLVALITMTIDHLYYVFPDLLWLRVVGRASFPIWLFLVGYHAAGQKAGDWQKVTRNIPAYLIGCVLLVFADYATSRAILPINILIAIFLVQILFLMPFIRRISEEQPLTLFVYCIIFLPSLVIIEYGSLGVMFGLLGFLIRKKNRPQTTKIITLGTILFYILVENFTFNFPEMKAYLAAAIIMITVYSLTHISFEKTRKMPAFICALTRNSLLYYVLHSLFLLALGALITPPTAYFVFKLL